MKGLRAGLCQLTRAADGRSQAEGLTGSAVFRFKARRAPPRFWTPLLAQGNPLPDLPPPNGGKVHRMGFYHVISDKLCGGDREELGLGDPTATNVFIYTPKPYDESTYRGYQAGPRQYNPRIVD